MSGEDSGQVGNGGGSLGEKIQTAAQQPEVYSPKREAQKIFHLLCALKGGLSLPEDTTSLMKNVEFTSERDMIYFPIPFKETETAAALKGIEALVATSLASLKYGEQQRRIKIDLEQTTCFLFQTYLSTIDGLGKYDAGTRTKLKSETPFYDTCRLLISAFINSVI